MPTSMLDATSAALFNALGRYDEALEAAERGCDADELSLYAGGLVELVEAAVHGGRPEIAPRRVRAAASAHAGERHRLGARARGPLAGAADRRAGRRGRSTRRRSPAWPAPTWRRTWPARSWSTASGCAANSAGARPANSSARRTTPSCRLEAEAWAERARRELAATGETVRKRTRRDARRADVAGVADRAPGGRRAHQSGDRGAAVHQPQDRRVPPGQDLSEARHRLPARAAHGARRAAPA